MVETSIRVCLAIILAIMGIQDFKYRGITWYLFPALAILLWFSNANFNLADFILNVGFVVFIYVLLNLWISIKERAFINLTRFHLGTGDLLFLLCLSFYFPPLSFFLFYGISLLLISIIYGLYFLLSKPKENTIPLAGMQGLILLFIMMIGWYLRIDPGNACLFEDYLEFLTQTL